MKIHYLCDHNSAYMNIKEAVFAGSSTKDSEKPSQRLPEFAFIGRSNVGKSSLINMLCGNRKLAHTSATPGKTKLINHFLINRQWYLVDLPGYGYAKLSKTAIAKLDKIIWDYINKSSDLVLLFVLLDSRHELMKTDLDFMIRLGEAGIPFSIIFTKSDKSGRQALERQVDSIRKALLEYWDELPPSFISSSETKAGRDEILDYIESVLQSIRQK